MSIITQARLTLLPHKCLSMVTRCYESGYIQRHHHSYQTLTQHKQTLNALSNNEPQYKCLFMKVRKLNQYDTPKPCQQINHILDKTLVKKPQNEITNTNLTLLIVKNITQSFKLLNSFHNSWTKPDNRTTYNYQPHKRTNYLLKRARKLLYMQRNSKSITTTATATNSSQNGFSEKRNKSHGDERYDNDQDNFRKESNFEPSIFPIFALLGLFRGMTASDIEDEKTKLTDEQKMKKMSPGELYIAKGVLSMCDQDYARANELFHSALRYAQDHNDEDQENLVLNLLASNYFESGDLENAEKLFIDIMKRMIAHDVEPTDLAILELSLKLASIYSKDYRAHEKALKGFKFVISTLLNNLQDIVNSAGELEIQEISEDRKDELALLGWSYDWFAKHLIATDDYEGAAQLLRKALKISSHVLGPLHDQTLILLNDIGTTMAMNNSPEEGKDYLKKAVEGAIESQSKELASFYVNLGLVNLKLKQLDEAKRYCEYSIEVALKNPDHHNSGEVIKLSQSCLHETERISGNR